MINSNIQDKLRAQYNPDGSDLRNMQLRMLDMLKYVDNICKENDIKYWLSSGTCLGAVRHGGFIPWDDDLDIEMYEKDYMKLKKILLKKSDSPYIWQDQFNDEGYRYSFGKLRDLNSHISEIYGFNDAYKYDGIFIDVFQITPSNSKILRRISGYIFYKLMQIAYACDNKKLIKLIKYATTYAVMPILESIQKIGANGRYRHKTSFLKPRFKKHIGDTINIPFESFEFPVPQDVDSYLKIIYGDYMNLPENSDMLTHTTHVTIK